MVAQGGQSVAILLRYSRFCWEEMGQGRGEAGRRRSTLSYRLLRAKVGTQKRETCSKNVLILETYLKLTRTHAFVRVHISTHNTPTMGRHRYPEPGALWFALSTHTLFVVSLPGSREPPLSVYQVKTAFVCAAMICMIRYGLLSCSFLLSYCCCCCVCSSSSSSVPPGFETVTR